jgi:hypothetical protein
MVLMNKLRAIAGGKFPSKEKDDQGRVERAADKEGFVKTAEVHRIYPVANTATDPRLVELLKVIAELRADREDLRTDRDAWRDLALQARRRRWRWSR